MKYNKHIILLLVGLVFGLSSCKDWDELNTDPKNPTETDAGTLVAYAEKYLSDQYNRVSVNHQPGLLLAQYWAQGPYPQISRYQFEGRNLSDNFWGRVYIRVLKNLISARSYVDQETATSEEVKANKKGIITVLEVFAWQWLVDTYGNVPYTDALAGRDIATPKYDDAKDIYLDLLDRLDDAIDDFDKGAASFGTQDIIYNGTVDNWVKFANSLKLRLAIRLIDEEETLAKDALEEAAKEVFTSNSDHAMLNYLPGSVNGHPHYSIVLSGRADFAVSKTLVDVMNNLEDPRRPLYMDTVEGGKFVGLEYGLSEAVSDLTPYSKASPAIMDATAKGELMSFSEVKFILAEAAELHGVSVGNAEDHYNEAITASILQYGGTQDDADTYLQNNDVDWATAEGGDKKKAIAMQKWISLYKNGFEGWFEWKRLDYPVLVVPAIAESIPVRIKYPVNEQTLNGANVKQAGDDIGGDAYDTKIFWDKD